MKNLLLILLLLPTTSFVFADEFDTIAYVQNHCIRCHGEDEQNADRRFDRLGAELSEHQTAEHWQEILDIVNLGEMPPEDELQPTAEETKQFVATVTRQLEVAREALATGGQERFRRLNRYEYRNTIRDLLGVNMDSFDPTTSFPADDRVDGFDNIGESLVLSDYLLQCYLEAASRSIEKKQFNHAKSSHPSTNCYERKISIIESSYSVLNSDSSSIQRATMSMSRTAIRA
jgi:hypothetical protein